MNLQDFTDLFNQYGHHKFLYFTLNQWTGLLSIFIIAFFLDQITRKILINFISKHFQDKEIGKHHIDFKKIITPLKIFNLTISLYVGTNFVGLDKNTLIIIQRMSQILFAIASTMVVARISDIGTIYLEELMNRDGQRKFNQLVIPMMSKTAKFLIYSIGAIFIAQSLTINVTSLITGLGIGGLAFALAAKDTLSNIFGSLTVILDNPFNIGDYVKIGSLVEGDVEEVGFRSTKIRSPQNSLVTIPNNQLTNIQIENLTNRDYRRFRTSLNVEYGTSTDQLNKFCEGIKEIIQKLEHSRKDVFHVWVENLGASSIDIMLNVFFKVETADQEFQQKHLLLTQILDLAKKQQIDFAYPTQTLHLKKD